MAAVHRIAVVQMHPEASRHSGGRAVPNGIQPMRPDLNYKKAESFIRSAAAQGAQLVVLPEYHLAGWAPDDSDFSDACAAAMVCLKRYQALAAELSISIVPGTIIVVSEKPADGSKPLHANVAYFIGPTGEILGSYTKKNLWGSIERDHLESSKRDPHIAFDTPLGRVGMLVCWDLAFPEAFRELVMQGAKLIIIPTFWKHTDCSEAGLARNPASEVLFLDSTLTSRCFENTCAIAFANAGGPPGEGYCGLSQVCAPFVGPISRLGSSTEGIIVCDLDMQMVEDAEANYQVRSDLNSEGWHYEYRHPDISSNSKTFPKIDEAIALDSGNRFVKMMSS